MASQITNEHIERLYACALEAGAHCAKISGAGGGGFMMFLTDPIHKDKVAAALLAKHDGGMPTVVISPPAACRRGGFHERSKCHQNLARRASVMQAVAADSTASLDALQAAEKTAAAHCPDTS